MDEQLPRATKVLPAGGWIEPATQSIAQMRAAEIAVCLAGHIRNMGFSARAHIAGNSRLDMERLAILSGVAVRDESGQAVHPYLGADFAIAVVSTEYSLETDNPLSKQALRRGAFRRLKESRFSACSWSARARAAASRRPIS